MKARAELTGRNLLAMLALVICSLAAADSAASLFEKFSEVISKRIKTQQGWFGAAQEVSIVNEGPVTLIVEK